MKVLIAFDVDGTLEVGSPKGPIKLLVLKKLKEKGFIIGTIGASGKVERALPGLDFYRGGHPNKAKHMAEVKERFKPDLCIYVADAPVDREEELKAGFCYVKPEDFNPKE